MSDQTSTRFLSTLLRNPDGTGTVRVQDDVATGVEDLWSALTEPDRLARWIAEVEGDLRPGGEFRISFTSSWQGAGRVDACEAPHRLLLTMSDEDGETTIEATLQALGSDRTRLVIEDRGLPLEQIAAHGAGWQVHVEDLSTALAGGTPSPWRERWQQLIEPYRQVDVESA